MKLKDSLDDLLSGRVDQALIQARHFVSLIEMEIGVADPNRRWPEIKKQATELRTLLKKLSTWE